jgi:hypothetical protein
MRIHYMSDVHLEFGALEKPLPKGEVVILAGDITLLAAMDPAKTDASARAVRKNTLQFFDAVQRSFGQVFYLMGNHEHYGFCIDESADAIRHYFPGVTLLEDGHVALGDAILCGATLWTDMGGGDPLAEQTVQRSMSDFYVIEKRDGDRLRSFRPSDARVLFVAVTSKGWRCGRDKKRVATHHARQAGVAPERTSRSMRFTSGPHRLHRGASQYRRVDPWPQRQAGYAAGAGVLSSRARLAPGASRLPASAPPWIAGPRLSALLRPVGGSG